jgi:hypothetical protein
MIPRSHRLRHDFSRLAQALRSPLERVSAPGEGQPSTPPLNSISGSPNGEWIGLGATPKAKRVEDRT